MEENLENMLKKYLNEKMELYKVDNAVIIFPTDCLEIKKFIKKTEKTDFKILQTQMNNNTDSNIPNTLSISISNSSNNIKKTGNIGNLKNVNSNIKRNKNAKSREIKNKKDSIDIKQIVGSRDVDVKVKTILQHYLTRLTEMLLFQDNKYCWVHKNFISSLSHQ